jgi:hypothetical protein
MMEHQRPQRSAHRAGAGHLRLQPPHLPGAPGGAGGGGPGGVYVEYTLERAGDSWWREVVLLEAG